MTGEIEQVPERWRYLGRRETQNERLGAMWRLPGGEDLLFNAKRPPKVVGAIYEVTVHRSGDAISIGASPKFVEAPSSEDTEVARLEAEDRAALTANALRKAEAKAKHSSPRAVRRTHARRIAGDIPAPAERPRRRAHRTGTPPR